MKISHFRFLFLILAALSVGAVPAGAQEAHWLTDYNRAIDQAKTENKNILMDFTGSDWCPWCMKMDKDVLNTSQFKAYADNNLVLLLVDFPQSKPLPQKVQDQNNDLQQKYDAEGFPTFILINKDGSVLGRLVGYVEGGPSAFIAKIESMKK